MGHNQLLGHADEHLSDVLLLAD
jgi:hypothetical protein